MSTNFSITANLANDPQFQSRVQAAMVTAALNVSSESIGAMPISAYTKRHDLATGILQNTMGPNGFVPSGTVAWLNQFAWAVAISPAIAAEVGTPVTITSSSPAVPTVITTATAHGLTTGNWVEINAHLVNLGANGTWPVTVTDTTHFTIPAGSALGGTGGLMTAQPSDDDIQTTTDSVFGNIAGVGTVI